ncbi:bifunctional acetate--CoA ligase family protein/GNAT family N-acetyltransferase [Paractinoplanes brasiliensis]|uniref:Acyl-CoA synthetase (NDP forming) n=2 Tax=Paractinoplanes brasiliensis TaxID=52695 RepID=A0A4R6JLV4_9ACTN|nr:bifunctional GNAT family N-acetyltransferase/acetate--CoA ligase family protein [Actinoplanes brasiliensis]TDO36682.1 acyl-CoA synthetase (NDP forming) [Actinoplanes brasiliensis]
MDHMGTAPAGTTVDALTSDGGIVAIRPVRPGDRNGLAAMFRHASADSLRLRFFAAPSETSLDAEVERLCRPETTRHLTMLAVEGDDLVGVASCESGDEASERAEFSLFVADQHHGRGIGTLLLEHLAARARRAGIQELTGEILPANRDMLRVAHDLSVPTWTRFDDGIFDIGLDTGADERAYTALDRRDRVSERASLRALLSPASIAVVGAGHRPGGVGHETACALREYGFGGPLYVVNRSGAQVAGLAARRRVADLPAPIDLLVVAVPADDVAGVLEQGAQIGVRAAVVLSAGFGEAGEEGRQLQHDLVRLARRHGIRLVGPNCLGIVNTDPRVRMNASFAPSVPASGGLAVAAQSGAVGVALLDDATRAGYGISSFVSLGNKADVSGNDLIAYWYDDPATQAIALYLESFGNPRKFARTVRALGRRKPVLALKSGRSASGRRAGASHTAAAAAPDATVDALFAQAGVIRPEDLGEMTDAARMLTGQPLPAGERLVVVGNAGGLNVLASDAAEAAGLTVPALSARLRERLQAVTKGAASTDNPIDLGAGAPAAAFAAAAEAVAGSGEADMLLLVVIGTRSNDPAGIVRALGEVVDRYPALTAAAVVVGAGELADRLGKRGAPVYGLPERAVRALSAASRYAAWRREPLGARPRLTGVRETRARAAVGEGLTAGAGWQPFERTAAILTAYGIALEPAATAMTAEEATEAAERIGCPVVVKSADPDLVHKTDVGGVRVGLTGPDEVRGAFDQVAAVGRPGSGVLVQKQITEPVELVAGVAHDPLFGSVVLLGLGGVHTDILGDTALRLVPMTDLDAGRMWRGLRGAPLLTGYRGSAAVDTAALEEFLLRVGRLAEDFPEIAELDLNPVLAGPGGVVAVDAKLRLAPIGAEPDSALRVLRAADA